MWRAGIDRYLVSGSIARLLKATPQATADIECRSVEQFAQCLMPNKRALR
jgi:hypothetical protein